MSYFEAKMHQIQQSTRRPVGMLLLIEQLKLMTVPSLTRMSVVIISWLNTGCMVKLRTKYILRHNHLGIRTLAYPEGFKRVQHPLNVFSCVFTQKYCPSSAPVFNIS